MQLGGAHAAPLMMQSGIGWKGHTMINFIGRVEFDRMTQGDRLDYISAKRTVSSAKRVAANMAANGYFRGARDANAALKEARQTMRTIEARYR